MATMQAVDQSAVRSHRITGGGGVQLHVAEAGNPSGRPVLFIHGLSQSHLAWNRQLHSILNRHLRMVAIDLRGHGESERPVDAYGDSVLWADDVHAVITSLDLKRPVLTGWSYGGVVICDYLRQYGEEALGGVHLTAAISRLGEPILPFLAPPFLATLPGLFSADAGESISSLQTFGRLLTFEQLNAADSALILGTSAAVPPWVRQQLLSRTLDYDSLLASLTLPVLISHGLEDDVVLPAMGEHHASLIPHAQTSYYPNVGHSPFWEDPDRFDSELRSFAGSL